MLDGRRLKNMLKSKYSYECHLLGNPCEEEIRNTISECVENMNWTSKDARLLIYFSGSATKNEGKSLHCLLNATEKLDLASLIQEKETLER